MYVVTYLRPSHGGSSPWPEHRASVVVDEVADTAAIARAIDELVTLGWSGGGPRALATAARLPGRCRGAVSLAARTRWCRSGSGWPSTCPVPARLFDDAGHLTLVGQLDRVLGDLRAIAGL
jgi:pimeloyl-ACP methyl ester carboxylesterase